MEPAKFALEFVIWHSVSDQEYFVPPILLLATMYTEHVSFLLFLGYKYSRNN